MKTKIITTAALVCCFITCFAVAADMTGTWVGTLKSPNGDYPLKYTFKSEGDKGMGGTVLTPKGMLAINDGKLIDGSIFIFNVDVSGVSIKNDCKYYADGDSVVVTLDYNGYKMNTTLQREPKK